MTITNNIIQNATSSDYRFVVVRSDDGNATIALQHLVTINNVPQWQTAMSGTVPVTQSNAGWDDAIPWAAGTYDLTFAGTYINSSSYSWKVPDGEIAGRDGIRLHLGSQAQPPQALEGCIGATTAFLKNAHDVLMAANEISSATKIPLVVSDSSATLFPIQLKETVSTASLKPGDTATITISLVGGGTADGVSKDIYVHVPITKTASTGIAAFGTDYTITSANGGLVEEKYATASGSHNGSTWPAGEYLLLPKGKSSVTYTVMANPNVHPAANEAVNLTIDNYYVERVLGTDPATATTTDYTDHATPKILLNGASLNGQITIVPDPTLTSDHLSGGIQGVLKTYAVHAGDTITFGFQAYTIPDFLSITDGSVVYGTGGFVSDYHSGSFITGTNSITVKVVGSSAGTAWDLDISDQPASTATQHDLSGFAEDDMDTSALGSLLVGAAMQTAAAAILPPVSVAATAAPAAATLQLVSSTRVTVPASGSASPVTFQALAGQSYLVRLVGSELRPQTDTLTGGSLGVTENNAAPATVSTGSNLFGEPAAWLTAGTNETVSLTARAGAAGGTAEVEIYNATNATKPILFLQADVTDQQTRGSDQGIAIVARRVGNVAAAATYLLDIIPTGTSPITIADVDGGSLQRSVTFAAGEDTATAIIYPQRSSSLTGSRTASVVFDPATVPADSVANGTLLGLPESLSLTILDNPPHSALVSPVITATNAAGAAGSGVLTFAVQLSAASSNPVSVSYVTNDVSAIAGSDYAQGSGVLTFQPGELSKQVSVQLLGAARGGSDRTFQLNLLSPFGGSLPSNATVLTELGTITEATVSGSQPGASQSAPVYRFFDTQFGTHLFTQSATEAQQIISARPDLVQETNGFGAVAPNSPSAEAVYRFFENANGTHFFTSSASEFVSLTTPGTSTYRPDLTYESSSTFYEHAAPQAGDVAVYRLFDTGQGTQFLTGDQVEYAGLVTPGSVSYRVDLKPEGIAFYAPQGSFHT